MSNKLLSVKNLKKNFHDKNIEIKALEDITFDLYEQEFISIVGPSGCGKSTILSILSLLEKPSQGKVNYSKDVNIGYMLQDDSLFEWRTILDNCLIGLEINNKLNKETKAYVINLLKTYGLGDFINQYPSNLSGGMRQRVG